MDENRPAIRGTQISGFVPLRSASRWAIALAIALVISCSAVVSWVAHRDDWRVAVLISSMKVAGMIDRVNRSFRPASFPLPRRANLPG